MRRDFFGSGKRRRERDDVSLSCRRFARSRPSGAGEARQGRDRFKEKRGGEKIATDCQKKKKKRKNIGRGHARWRWRWRRRRRLTEANPEAAVRVFALIHSTSGEPLRERTLSSTSTRRPHRTNPQPRAPRPKKKKRRKGHVAPMAPPLRLPGECMYVFFLCHVFPED